MLGKRLAWLMLSVGFLASNGCCAMWERWCDRSPRCYQPAPCTCAPAPQACPPNNCYSPPPAAVAPVPQWQPPPR